MTIPEYVFVPCYCDDESSFYSSSDEKSSRCNDSCHHIVTTETFEVDSDCSCNSRWQAESFCGRPQHGSNDPPSPPIRFLYDHVASSTIVSTAHTGRKGDFLPCRPQRSRSFVKRNARSSRPGASKSAALRQALPQDQSSNHSTLSTSDSYAPLARAA